VWIPAIVLLILLAVRPSEDRRDMLREGQINRWAADYDDWSRRWHHLLAGRAAITLERWPAPAARSAGGSAAGISTGALEC
jgi:hypothetical protein